MKKKWMLTLALFTVLLFGSTVALSLYMPIEPVDVEACMIYCQGGGGGYGNCLYFCSQL